MNDDSMDDWGPPDDEDDMLVECPHCGEQIFDDTEQCPYCRMFLSRSDFDRPKSVWVIVLIIVLIASLALWSLV
ncbi:MAG: zinc ribbon domain-containing protein [Planctomycetota bacterium]